MKKTWRLVLGIIFVLVVAAILSSKLSLMGLFSKQAPIDPKRLSGNFDPSQKKAYFNNKSVNVPLMASEELKENYVLGDTSEPKRIEVDLVNQRLYAYQGGQKIYDFAISSGKWSTTPTGTFQIWIKLRYALMTGGSKALGTYYYLPNVPYTMYFYNDQSPKYMGYGIHGAYWHNNFGHPMSHGCINMKPEEVEILYYWAQSDTPITIYGETPET